MDMAACAFQVSRPALGQVATPEHGRLDATLPDPGRCDCLGRHSPPARPPRSFTGETNPPRSTYRPASRTWARAGVVARSAPGGDHTGGGRPRPGSAGNELSGVEGPAVRARLRSDRTPSTQRAPVWSPPGEAPTPPGRRRHELLEPDRAGAAPGQSVPCRLAGTPFRPAAQRQDPGPKGRAAATSVAVSSARACSTLCISRQWKLPLAQNASHSRAIL